jgi:fatty acid desaturase
MEPNVDASPSLAGPFSRPPTGELAIDRKVLKSLMRRSDGVALARLGICIAALGVLGIIYARAIGTWWVIPAILLFGSALSLTVYSLSHECSHGTPFKTRWLNETLFWVTSLLFGQEVLYRRYSHAAHHTHTMFVDDDAQLPFRQPVSIRNYALWYSGAFYHSQFLQVLLLHSVGRFSEKTRWFTPPEELPRLVRNSRVFLLIYAGIAIASIYFSSTVVLWLWVLPKLVGDPIMLTYAASQHFEMEENTIDLRRSTRSLRAHWLVNLFYWNMSYHIEHHLYPTVPFFALPKLNGLLADRLPPSADIARVTFDIFQACRHRSVRAPV